MPRGGAMRNHLQVLEHYTSVQGEGLRTGELTQFVRFAGCNLRCPGWPCDTQHAIQPSLYIGKYSKQTAALMVKSIEKEFDKNGARNICFTGGEPLMQPVDVLHDVVRDLSEKGFEFEIFTNGTYPIPEWFLSKHQVMMDFKLPGSGEYQHIEESDMGDVRRNNLKRLKPWHGVKFVCKHMDDLNMAIGFGEHFRQEEDVVATYWIGAAFGEISEKDIVEFMMSRQLTDWRLNVQVHKYIWDPTLQGV